MQQIAFFDMDDTILKGDSIRSFLKFYVKKKPHKIFKYAALLPKAILLLFDLIDNKTIKIQISSMFRKDSVSEMSLIGLEFANEIVPKTYYKDALRQIEWHKKQGDTLILITASYDFYAEHIAKNLGFDKCIATKLAQVNGVYTGVMSGNNCYNEEKRLRLHALGYSESKEYHYAYSDSISDLPLFDFAAKKICVNPSSKLEKFAKNHSDDGFSIIKWS